MPNDKKILHGTIFSEDYWYFLPWYLKYTKMEKEQYPEMDSLIITNNMPKENIEALEEVIKEYPWISVKDIGLVPNPRIGMLNMRLIISGKNAMFNAGIEGGYSGVYIVDFDTIPNPGSLKTMIGYFSMPKVGIIGGNYHFKRLRSVVGGPIVVGKFPVKDEELKKMMIEGKEWTDKVIGLGFGFTLFPKEIFSNPEFHCSEKYLEEDQTNTEDYPVCRTVQNAGYRLIWLREVRAKHLYYNHETKVVEAW